ncbi:MAG: tetratricopeptide repeat protein [Planctomycetes bacterium]|nr:tetratricopeptide repeat protein [Planctomycetota bacterium]
MNLVAFVLLLSVPMQGDTVDALLKEAAAAAKQGQVKKALAALGKAMEVDAKDPRPYLERGKVLVMLGKHKEAAQDFAKVLQRDAKSAEAYQQRGSAYFRLGKIKESIADFDKFIELRPDRKPWHWQRGISYYYVKRFKEGKEQFEAYQTVDGADVENVVWRYLCQAKIDGVKKAQADMLPVGEDRRVPMKEIYQMFLGKLKPEDVMKAAKAGKPSADEKAHRLFYAHLYLGLYYESLGEAKKALEHLSAAADDEFAVGGYMWDVARVHRDIRALEAKKKE